MCVFQWVVIFVCVFFFFFLNKKTILFLPHPHPVHSCQRAHRWLCVKDPCSGGELSEGRQCP